MTRTGREDAAGTPPVERVVSTQEAQCSVRVLRGLVTADPRGPFLMLLAVITQPGMSLGNGTGGVDSAVGTTTTNGARTRRF